MCVGTGIKRIPLARALTHGHLWGEQQINLLVIAERCARSSTSIAT